MIATSSRILKLKDNHLDFLLITQVSFYTFSWGLTGWLYEDIEDGIKTVVKAVIDAVYAVCTHI